MLGRLAVIFLACAATNFSASAQTPDPRDIFAPLTFPDPASPTRSAIRRSWSSLLAEPG